MDIRFIILSLYFIILNMYTYIYCCMVIDWKSRLRLQRNIQENCLLSFSCTVLWLTAVHSRLEFFFEKYLPEFLSRDDILLELRKTLFNFLYDCGSWFLPIKSCFCNIPNDLNTKKTAKQTYSPLIYTDRHPCPKTPG